jgi:ubiquitin C-terminal hydrolase
MTNLGNTCYMSVCFQIMHQTAAIRRAMHEEHPLLTVTGRKMGELIREDNSTRQNTMAALQRASDRITRLKYLVEAMRRLFKDLDESGPKVAMGITIDISVSLKSNFLRDICTDTGTRGA